MGNQVNKIVEVWSEISLGEVLKYEQPYNYAVDDTQYSSNSGIPVLTAGKSFILGYTNETNRVYSNLPVIIFDDFTTDCKYVDFPFKVKSSAMKFLKEKKEHEVDLKFMFEILQSVKLQTTGGDHKRRWISEYSKIKIKAPKYNEQTRIAQILSKADAAIARTEALIAKYQRIKTGLMQDLLTRGIDEHGNIRNKATHRFVVKNGIEMPEEWEVTTLENLTRSVITYGIVQAGPHIPDGIPYIRTGDMSDDFLSIENLLRTTKEIASRFQRSQVEVNDIVFALRATIGKVLIVPKELHGANLTQGTARIAPNLDKISPIYLLWTMRMFYFENQILKIQKGTTFAEITLGELRQMIIIHPRNLHEQNRISAIIQKQEATIQSYKSNLQKLKSLKTGLMQDLLSGKVRVKV